MLNMLLRALVILLVLLGVGAAALCLYNRYYRNRANRILEGKLNGRDSDVAPAPAPHTVWKVILVLVLFVAFCAWEIDRSKDLSELRQLWEVTYSTVSQTYSTVNSINARLAEMRQSFVSFDYKTERLDVANRTMVVRVTAVPKEDHPDTTVSLYYDDAAIPLIREANGVYTAVLSLDLFRLPKAEFATLCLTESGQTKAEEVYLHPDVWGVFPRMKLDVSNAEIRQEKTSLKLRAEFYVAVSDPEQLRSLRLLLKQDGRVIEELDLTEASRSSVGTASLEGEYPNDAAIYFVLQWEDSYGLRHESTQYLLDQNGTEITQPYGDEQFGHDTVYAADGTLLGELR